MQFRLRSLMIWLAIGPPLLAGTWFFCQWIGAWESAKLGVVFVVGSIWTWISFAADRRFYREVNRRLPLDDGQFYHQFYADGEVPPDLVRRLRPIYCRFFGIHPAKARPLDLPPLLAELDTTDLVREIEAELGLTISDQEAEQIDGSFDSIVRRLAKRKTEGVAAGR